MERQFFNKYEPWAFWKWRCVIIFIPYYTLQINTNLESDEIREKLQSIVAPPSLLWNLVYLTTKPFQGKIGEKHFKITRINEGGKIEGGAFSPVIKGEIKQNAIIIKMRLRISMTVFMSFGIIFVGVTGLSVLIEERNVLAYLMFLMIMASGYVMTTGSFRYGAYKASTILKELFE